MSERAVVVDVEWRAPDEDSHLRHRNLLRLLFANSPGQNEAQSAPHLCAGSERATGLSGAEDEA
jgi:hypothetical protein